MERLGLKPGGCARRGVPGYCHRDLNLLIGNDRGHFVAVLAGGNIGVRLFDLPPDRNFLGAPVCLCRCRHFGCLCPEGGAAGVLIQRIGNFGIICGRIDHFPLALRRNAVRRALRAVTAKWLFLFKLCDARLMLPKSESAI